MVVCYWAVCEPVKVSKAVHEIPNPYIICMENMRPVTVDAYTFKFLRISVPGNIRQIILTYLNWKNNKFFDWI